MPDRDEGKKNMKALIKGQKLRVDNHHRGDGSPLDMPFVHVHKSTKYPIEGKLHQVDIEIPLEEHGTPRILVENERQEDIPRPLLREIQDVLANKDRSITFAREIIEALRNYNPADENVAIEALERIAKSLGLRWQEKHIRKVVGRYGGTAMRYELRDLYDRRIYSLMVNPIGLQMEDTMRETFTDEERRKYIIVNRGRTQRGKTPSIKLVFEILAKEYPHYQYPVDGDDIKAIIDIDGVKVGIESQGDPGYRMEESMDEFEAIGCDIIYTAARPMGPTYDKVFEMNTWYGYEILLDENPRPYYDSRYTIFDDGTLDMMNQLYAQQTAQLIVELTKRI